MPKAALTVAALFFCLGAIAHIVRYFIGFDIIIAGTEIPQQASVIAAIVAGVLGLWMFAASKRV